MLSSKLNSLKISQIKIFGLTNSLEKASQEEKDSIMKASFIKLVFFIFIVITSLENESNLLTPCQLIFQSDFNRMLKEWVENIQEQYLDPLDWSALFYPAFYRIPKNRMETVIKAWQSGNNDIEDNGLLNDFLFFQFLIERYKDILYLDDIFSLRYQPLLKTIETMILTMSVQYPNHVQTLIPKDILSPNDEEFYWQRHGPILLVTLRARAAIGDEVAIDKLIAIVRAEFEGNLYPSSNKQKFFNEKDPVQTDSLLKNYQTMALGGLTSVRDSITLRNKVLPELIKIMNIISQDSINSNRDIFVMTAKIFVYLSIISDDFRWLDYIFENHSI